MSCSIVTEAGGRCCAWVRWQRCRGIFSWSFFALCCTAGARPRIMAEVDDMAMLRLLAREGEGLALVPPVVVRDEIESGVLVETHRIAQILETFYAITPSRRFPNPLVGELVAGMAKAKGIRKT